MTKRAARKTIPRLIDMPVTAAQPFQRRLKRSALHASWGHYVVAYDIETPIGVVHFQKAVALRLTPAEYAAGTQYIRTMALWAAENYTPGPQYREAAWRMAREWLREVKRERSKQRCAMSQQTASGG